MHKAKHPEPRNRWEAIALNDKLYESGVDGKQRRQSPSQHKEHMLVLLKATNEAVGDMVTHLFDVNRIVVKRQLTAEQMNGKAG